MRQLLRNKVQTVGTATFLLMLGSFSWTQSSIEEYSETGVDTDKIVWRVLPVLLAGVALLLVDLRSRMVAMRRMLRWPGVAVVWYAVASAIMGTASPLPALAAWKSVELLAISYWMASGSAIGLRNGDPEHLSRTTATVVVWVVLYTFAAALINPGAGFEPVRAIIPIWIKGYWPGINPNTLGALALVALLGLTDGGIFHKRSFLRWAAGAICLITFVLAQSRTSFVAGAVIFLFRGLSLMVSSGGRLSPGNVVKKTMVVLVAVGALVAHERLEEVFARGQAVGQIEDLSGRTKYWEVAAAKVEKNPWLGGGLATGSRFLYLDHPEIFPNRLVNLHNTFLEILVDGGIIGGALFGFLIIRMAIWGVHHYTAGGSEMRLSSAMAVTVALRSTTSIAVALFSQDTIVLMAAASSYAVRRDQTTRLRGRQSFRVRG